MEIETDKVTVEVEAPADGTLAGIRVAEGDDVPVGDVVALIVAAGEEPPATAPAAVDAAGPAMPALAATDGNGLPPTASRARRPLASPKARRIAKERGVDLASIAGSGPRGAVVAADVELRRGDGAEPAAARQSQQIGPIWTRMAERTTQLVADRAALLPLRETSMPVASRPGARARASAMGTSALTHTDLLVKLAAAALRRHPRVNASWRDGGIAASDDVNVGIAVAVDDGLVVPVVHGADGLALRAVVDRRTEVVEAARAGKLRPDDVGGATFTISNLGMFGVDAFAAILNAPQAAILAVGRIADRIVPVDGRPEVRPMCTLTLSFDHRVVDGARGARFLETLAELIEEPAGLID